MNMNRKLWMAALMALFLLPVTAFAAHVSDLYITVKDLNTGAVVGTVDPNGTISLPEGARVRLIMTAVRGGKEIYPQTQFRESDPGRGWVRVPRTSTENANATVEIVRPGNSNRARSEMLYYHIVDSRYSGPRDGSVRVVIGENGAVTGNDTRGQNGYYPNGGNPNNGYYPNGGYGTNTTTRSRELVGKLYQAILMRDMDPGAQTYIDQVDRDGYQGVINSAVQIANSEESRIRLYERTNVSLDQRLNNLYRVLLGWDSGQVDRQTWDSDIQRIHDGRIADVVRDIVGSTRFRQLYAF